MNRIVNSLLKILHDGSVNYDEDSLQLYSADALDVTRALPPGFRVKRPIAIVRPESEGEVVDVVKFANRKSIPIVPYGGGTGLMGGATTVRAGIVMDLKNLNSIEVSREDQMIAAGSGAIIKQVDLKAREHGMIFAHDPWSASYATVGGAISTNGVGYLAGKYGSMGDQVLGLSAVMPDGRMLDMKPAKKISAGIDLRELFIGGEGVFGIVTSAMLRTYPIPESQQIHAYEFGNLEEGYRAVTKLFAAGIRPTSLDLFEVFDVGADAETRLWLQDEPGTRLYVVFDGLREEVNALSGRTKSIMESGKELGTDIAEEYWRSRYDIAERYISFIRSKKRSSDIKFDFIQVSIPSGRLLEFDRVCMRIASKYKIKVQGHGIWQQPEYYSMNLFEDSAKANDRMYNSINEMLRYASTLGTIEYCHGIGIRLAHLMDGERIGVLKRIKRALDPNNIMNPEKLSL